MNVPTASAAPVCLITGGSSGIGLAAADRFLSAGYRVLICGRSADRLAEAAAQLAASASATGESCLMTEVADLADPAEGLRLADRALSEWGQIDVLVNNAALAPLAPFADLSEKQLDETLAVNLRTPFRLTQRVWAAMAQRGTGTVIHVSSMAAVDPFPGFSLYGASKAWAELLTLALAAEGEPLGIRACAVRPGAVETPLLRSLFPDFPAEQCVSPAEVAEVIWGCVSRPDQYPSGQAFAVVAPASDSAS